MRTGIRQNRIFVGLLIGLVAVLGGLVLAACAGGYTGEHDVPDTKHNEVLFIERNRLSFAKDMPIDDIDVIERCRCTFTDGDGNRLEVTADDLRNGTVQYQPFDLETVGSNKQIAITYRGATNYIFYDVNDYTVNFYADEAQSELYKSVHASSALTDTLGLSVWVDLGRYNYSTDDHIREIDPDRAIRFDGWFDSSSNRATGLYTIAPPTVGNERVLDFHAHYITSEALADMKLDYDAAGRRVFSGYTGASTAVTVPEGVTYVDLAAVFDGETALERLHIPSTAALDVPLMTGIDTGALKTLSVDGGSLEYASYDGALYSKDFGTLYLMPADAVTAELHSALTEFGSYSCAYWRARRLVLPRGVTTLRHYCFAYSALSEIVGLENVRTIMAGVFYKAQVDSYDDGTALYTVRADGKRILSMILDPSVTAYTIADGTVDIAGDAFGGCKNLRQIDIPEGVESIGSSAFSGCESLERVTLPTSLRYLGEGIFYGCKALTAVNNLPDCTYIDADGKAYAHTLPRNMFYNCTQLADVTLPDGLLQIGSSAFRGCAQLDRIRLPEGLQGIGASAFVGCGFAEIAFPASLITVGGSAFAQSKLRTLDLTTCPLFDKLPREGFSGTQLTEVVIPERFGEIPALCFAQTKTLQKIDLGAVTSVGYQAFSGCSALKDIVWGTRVQTIEESSFSSCTALTSLTLPDSVRTVAYRAFQACTRLTEVTLGKGVTAFGNYTFAADGETFDLGQPALWQCTNVRSIAVAAGNPVFRAIDGVLYGNTVGGKRYGDCGVLYAAPPAFGIERFTFPASVRVVVPYAFQYQKSAQTITMNEGLTNIGKAAFFASTTLETVSVPASVTQIGAGIFLRCSRVQTFTIDENNKHYSSDGNLLYKNGALVLYLGLDSAVNIREGIGVIESAVFMENTVIKTLVIPDSVETIGEKAFNGCANLESIVIGKGLKNLDKTAFAALKSLKSVTVSADNPYFKTENNVLYTKDGKTLLLAAAKNGMTALDIPDSVTAIGDWAFAYHATLTDVRLPKNIRTVGDYAFYECRKIVSFHSAEALETIGTRAFSFELKSGDTVAERTQLCDTLQEVVLYGNLKSIGDYAFYGQFGIGKTYFAMSQGQVDALVAASGTGITYVTRGCPLGVSGKYVNNNERGIDRYLLSPTEPTINQDGYGWFYFDDEGRPQIWENTIERGYTV